MTTMTKMLRVCGAAAAALSLTGLAAAQTPSGPSALEAPKLDVRMGMWKMTMTTTVGGQMPSIDTSKMTPEQKQAMESMMKSFMGGHTITSNHCVTEEEFRHKNFLGADEPNSTCTQAWKTNTSTTLDGSVTCTGGDHPMSGHLHIDALSPTSINGTMHTTTQDQGRTMTVDMKMAGTWQSATCTDK